MGGPTRFFGILNLTPDSFSDGGKWPTAQAAFDQAARMTSEGAVVIDVGGQSTRPGHVPVPPSEEISRIRPVVERLLLDTRSLVSIDTYVAEVARTLLGMGAHLINDIHGLPGDPEMADVVSEFRCGAILMHCERDFASASGDVIDKIMRYFERSLSIAATAGVSEARIILDPGIGFHKTPEQNLAILGRVGELHSFGRPLLLGVSRKSVIGHVVGGSPADRLEGTLACTALAVAQGVEFLRVHDVLSNVRAARVAEAVLPAPSGAPA